VVIVVGNGVAGYACARALAVAGAAVTLVGPGPVVDRPPLSKQSLVDGRLRVLADSGRLAAEGIRAVDALACSVEVDERAVTLEDGTRLEGSELVVGAGLDYSPPSLSGLESALVTARPDECERAAALLTDLSARVVIVGGGLIGCETAAALGQSGHTVTLLELADEPLPGRDAELRGVARAALTESRVRFAGGVSVLGMQRHGEALVVEVAGASPQPADLVIAAVGGRALLPPGAEFLGSGPVVVDASMRASGVYVIGDLAVPLHQHFGRVRSPHWDTALRTAEVAARAILGEPAPTWEQVPYWWSDLGRHRIAEYGYAEAVREWDAPLGGVRYGRDEDAAVVCARVIDAPRRAREARNIVAAALELRAPARDPRG